MRRILILLVILLAGCAASDDSIVGCWMVIEEESGYVMPIDTIIEFTSEGEYIYHFMIMDGITIYEKNETHLTLKDEEGFPFEMVIEYSMTDSPRSLSYHRIYYLTEKYGWSQDQVIEENIGFIPISCPGPEITKSFRPAE
ncbi:hypothetical protein GOV10_04540 [Candidatus Woesearchaeota archaeon]|nr:hypothetical protein [Candidatus Woesearchaeota archaeon]